MRILGWGVIWARGFQMSEIKLVIYGEPVPQGRPKFARIGNHVHAYDPQKSKNYKQLVRYWVTQQLKKIEGFKPLENALYVDITFWLSIPSSWSKKKRIEADSGVIRPIKRPDADNLFKSLDALNGLLWVDDSIITDLHIRKRYTAEMARVEITVREVE
jgi:Holliday junction resolvase RusA-like endonuclease